jgi:HPt (histidine-containing phosphotransfer) domain-containing protein
MRGGAATLSAAPLSAAAAALEEASQRGSLAEAPEQCERLRQEFGRFVVYVEPLLAGEKTGVTA